MFYGRDWKPPEQRNDTLGLSRIRDEWWLEQRRSARNAYGGSELRWYFKPLNYCGDLISPLVRVFTSQYFDIR